MILYNWELNDWMSIISRIWDNFYVISLQTLTKKKQNTIRVYQDSRPFYRIQGAGDIEFWYTSSKFYSDTTYHFWLSTFSNLSAMSNPYIIELILCEFLCVNKTPSTSKVK